MSADRAPIHSTPVYTKEGVELGIYLGSICLVASKSDQNGYQVVTYPSKGQGWLCSCRGFQVRNKCRHLDVASVCQAMARAEFEQTFPGGIFSA